MSHDTKAVLLEFIEQFAEYTLWPKVKYFGAFECFFGLT